MPLLETPPLLVLGDNKDYISRLRAEYENKEIIIPEGKKILFFLKRDEDCLHFFCGKGYSVSNKLRAQRILFIRYILENRGIRIIKREMKTKNIIFFSEELLTLIICSELSRGGDWKCFTFYCVRNAEKSKFDDQSKYVDIAFN